jgi:hypothetical protein
MRGKRAALATRREATGQDRRLIGATRLPRKGDDIA